MTNDLVIDGTYQHYKNKKFYRVLDIAMHTETTEKMVIYKALYDCLELADDYGPNPTFVRPYNLFMATVEFEDKIVPRFQLVRK